MNRQEYLLNLVSEEGGEISQAANKCARFTPHHAYYSESNLARLQTEITDLITILYMLGEELKYEFELLPCKAKQARVEKFMQVSRDMGTLQDEVNP